MKIRGIPISKPPSKAERDEAHGQLLGFAALESDEAEQRRREELETAWLRGHKAAERRAGVRDHDSTKEILQEAADYAERVVGGSTRPLKPDPPPTPSKDENAA